MVVHGTPPFDAGLPSAAAAVAEGSLAHLEASGSGDVGALYIATFAGRTEGHRIAQSQGASR